MLAEGLTNRQLAERLVMSEHTVHRHVTNILRKLDVRATRAAAPPRAAWPGRPRPREMARSGDARAPRGGRSVVTMSTVWAPGDYHRFATELIWHFGPELVGRHGSSPASACSTSPPAPATSPCAPPSAARRVTACDITPEQLAARPPRGRGARPEIEWVEADAQALPFDDAAFDVVTTAAGRCSPPITAPSRAS